MADRDAEVRLKVDNSQYNTGIKESTTNTEKFNAALTKTSDTASKIVKTTGKGLLKIGAAEIAGLTALSAVAATLEKQTSNIQANLALNKTSSQYNAVTGSIRQMSREMPLARAEIAAMATSVSNLGMVTAKQIGGATETFGKMGIATGESSVGLANAMVQFQRSMGVAQPTPQTMNPYANAVTGLSARAGTNATDILGFGQSFAPAARVAGLSQASVLGISTAATKSGAEGAYAANTISQILNDITQLRYTKSPELGRYARALNMNVGELTRPTAGPEDQDKLMRNIISSVIAAAQTEEGPSRLSMIGIEGQRGRRALQSLAAEPGAVDKYIQQAEFGMTQPNIQKGFDKAAGGLTDQVTMLRNRATDVGQAVGEPMMNALTGFTKTLNEAAKVIQPFTDLITTIVGKLGTPIATLTMIAGGLLLVWKTISTLTFASRLAWNTGTKSFVGGAQDAQMIAAGRTGALSEAGQRMVNPVAETTRAMRAGYSIGGAFGAIAPGADTRAGIGQMLLRGIDRTTQFLGRESKDYYAKARMEPFTRLDTRLAQEQMVRDYRAAVAAGANPPIPMFNGRPLVYTNAGETLTTGGVVRGIGGQIFGTAGQAGVTGVSGVWTGAKGLAGFAADRAVVQPWQNMRSYQQAAGGVVPWAGMIARNAPGDVMSAGSRLGAGIGSIAANPMVMMMAAFAAIGAMGKERSQNKEWSDKFNFKEGAGLSDVELDNLSDYNEKLGLATRSLALFTKGVDEANPAKGEDINAELKNTANVREYGRNMDALVNTRLETIKTVDQAKEWIASQGPMNADQWVMVMRDFSKVFKSNQGAFEELNKWVQDNQKNGRVPVEAVKNVGTLGEMYNEEAQAGTNWKSMRGLLSASQVTGGRVNPVWWAIEELTGNDLSGTRGRTEKPLETLVGSQMARAKTIGETKDASSLFGGESRNLTIDQQTTLTRGEALSQVASKVLADNQALKDKYGSVKGVMHRRDRHEAAIALDQYIKAAGDAVGLDFSDIEVGGSNEDIKKDIRKKIEEAATYDETYKPLLENGLIDKILAGKPLSENLPDMTVLTSSQQAVKGTSFANVSDTVFDKYLGEGSLLGRGLLAAGNLSDPTDFHNATTKLLEFAKYVEKNKTTTAGAVGGAALVGGTGELGTLNRQFATLQEMKINNPEGTQGWNLAMAAQGRIQEQQRLEMAGMTSGQVRAQERAQVQALLPGLNVDVNKQAGDLQGKLDTARAKAVADQESQAQLVADYNVSRAREAYDWQVSMKNQEDDYNRSRLEGEDDFQRQMKRSRDSFNRQNAYSEAAFNRSLKYQQQDFYRSRQREAEAHARQMTYVAEDMAKSIATPYQRMQMQMIADPNAIAVNMENRLAALNQQNQAIASLRERGLSDRAVQQLDLTNPQNGQQTVAFGNRATDSDIAEFNRLADAMVGAADTLNKTDPSTVRSEKERDIGLKQSFDDFFRNLKRTKFEHAVSVKFNKKEFEIGVQASEEEHKIQIDRMAAAHDRMLERAAASRKRALQRQTEDLFGFAEDGIDMMWATTNKIIGENGLIDKYVGYLKKPINKLKEDTKGIIDDIDAALAAIGAARAENDKKPKNPAGDSGNPKEGWDTHPRKGQTVWSAKRDAYVSVKAWQADYPGAELGTETNPKDGWKTHPRKGQSVWSAKRNAYVSVQAWQKDYPGADLNKDYPGAKMAMGGIVEPQYGGRNYTVAEAGSAEAVIPLNARGIDFMSQFTKGVAREVLMSMPKTPVSAASTITYDHSNTMSIDNVEVKTNDPKEFVRQLKIEASKKRAALYKG